jgi:hypothetical protein
VDKQGAIHKFIHRVPFEDRNNGGFPQPIVVLSEFVMDRCVNGHNS